MPARGIDAAGRSSGQGCRAALSKGTPGAKRETVPHGLFPHVSGQTEHRGPKIHRHPACPVAREQDQDPCGSRGPSQRGVRATHGRIHAAGFPQPRRVDRHLLRSHPRLRRVRPLVSIRRTRVRRTRLCNVSGGAYLQRTTSYARRSTNTGQRGQHLVRGRVPALFVGHGAAVLTLDERDPTHRWLVQCGEEVAAWQPTAIVCVSAHYEAPVLQVTAGERPDTLHDHPVRSVYARRYAAPGSPALAGRVSSRARPARAQRALVPIPRARRSERRSPS